MDGALAFFWLSSWVNCILHILHGRNSRNSFPGSFLARCVLCGRWIVQNSHLYGRNARYFLTAFASAAYCANGAQQKTTVCIDGTLAIFRYSSLTRWVLCGHFVSKKCDLHGRNSRLFFADHLWPAFAVPPYTEITWYLVMISHSNGSSLMSFWGHVGVILGSKMV